MSRPRSKTGSKGRAVSATQIGSKWWAPDRNLAFVEATLEQVVTGERVRVKDKGGKDFECLFTELHPRSLKDEVYPNMDDLEELNMAEVLANLDHLYGRQQVERPGGQGGSQAWSKIYTSVGPVLIAMNPFQSLPCYGEEWVRAFRREGQAGRISTAMKNFGPHCYGVVEQAFQGLRRTKLQCVVICGESGAGKTVTNRKMIEYLMDAESLLSDNATTVYGHAAGKDQIAEANLFLEYFGNAKTLRNDNSSRFGKLTMLHFKDEAASPGGNMAFCGSVLGMEIKHYLLERSRVSWEPPGERTFHVFHQLLRSDRRKSFGLEGGPKDFRYTRSGADVESAFDEDQSFEALCTSLERSGLSEESQRPVFEALAAILHLGNIEFQDDSGASRVAPNSDSALTAACELLGVGKDALGSSLVRQELQVRTEKTFKNLNVAGSTALRDACAKIVYARVFDGLVEGVGKRLLPENAGAMGEARAIGLLDIFGFEDMPVNGLEQLFINLTNEQIQCIFNKVMFESERKIYEDDGLYNLVSFDLPPSNVECVKLFMGGPTPSPCIIGLLGDAVKVGSGQDGPVIVNKLNRELKASPFYTVCEAQRMSEVNKARRERWGQAVERLDFKECFQVRHYAGEVVYAVREFVSKSSDSLLPHMEALLASSSKPFIQGLFQGGGAPADKKAKSVGEKFREQLKELTKKLEGEDGGSSNLFVRCIKPNPGMKPGDVHRPMVLDQLVCGGVVAALEIRRNGYPDRLDYSSFIEEFAVISRRLLLRGTQVGGKPRERVMELLQGIEWLDELYACGTTRVFMRGGVLSDMRELQNFVQTVAARKIQRWARLRWGTQKIHTAETLKQELDAALADVQNEGIAGVDLVKRVAAEARAAVEPMWSALETAKAKHGSGKGAVQGIVDDMVDHFKHFNASQRYVGKLRDTAQAVVARRSRAEEVLSRRLNELKQEANKLALKLADLQRQLDQEASHSPEESTDASDGMPSLAELQVECQAAKDKLEAFLLRLPELQAAGPEGLDLSCEEDYTEPSEGVCPTATTLYKEVDSAVEEVESRLECLSCFREAWEKQTCGLRLEFSSLRARLQKLQPEGQEAVSELFTGVSEAMVAAWQTEEEAEKSFSERDKEGLEEKLALFQEHVAAAEGAAKAAIAFRAKRNQLEVEQLRAELDELDQGGSLRLAGKNLLKELQTASGRLDPSQSQDMEQHNSVSFKAKQALLKELNELEARLLKSLLTQPSMAVKRGSHAGVENPDDPRCQSAEWMWGDHKAGLAAKLNPFRWSSITGNQTVHEVIEQLKKCREEDLRRPVILKVPAGVISPEQRFETVKDALDALEGRVGTATAWSQTCSHRLPEDWESRGGAFLREAIVLKEEVSSSISLAVDSLNEGIIRCDSDYCIVYSANADGYYLLYRLCAKTQVYDRLGLK